MKKKLARVTIAGAITAGTLLGTTGIASADAINGNAPREVQLCQFLRKVGFLPLVGANQGECIKAFRSFAP